MKKTILITGGVSSGKLERSRQLAMMYAKDEVAILEYSEGFDDDRFASCTEKTKLIIIDRFDVTSPSFDNFFNGLHNFNPLDEIKISKQHDPEIWIKVQFVVVCNFTSRKLNKYVSKGASHERRFAEINCDKH